MSLLSAAAVWAAAANSYTELQSGAKIAGASPEGRYAVGYDPMQCDAGMVYLRSFIYDTEAGELEWVTQYDLDNLSNGGQFNDVSDAGMVIGTAKDMDHIVTWSDPMFGDSFSGPTAVAALWNGGICTYLPYGELDINLFSRPEDGTFGVGVSGDGNVAVGYAAYDNMAVIKPLMWNKNEAGQWSLTMLPIPENAKNIAIKEISGDGSVIIASAYVADNPAVIFWKGGEVGIIYGPDKENPADFINIQPLGISNNGRYVAISVNGVAAVYDMLTESYRMIEKFGDWDMVSQMVAVRDNGDVYGNYTGYPVNHPFIYSYKNDKAYELGYIMKLAHPDFEAAGNFGSGSEACFINVSNDGSRFAGNTSSWSGSGFVMEMEPCEVEIPDTPNISYGFSRAMNSVTLRWNAGQTMYSGMPLDSYNLYCGSELVKSIPPDGSGYEVVLENVVAGYPSYSIEAVYRNTDGKTVASPKSAEVKVAVAADFSLPLRETFDYSLEGNYWTTTSDYGTVGDVNQTIFNQAGVENGSGLYSSISSRRPYSFSLVSRPMDASDHKYVSVSFGFIRAIFMDTQKQNLENDTIAVEISTDAGDTWITCGKWSLDRMSEGNWCFKTLDISDKAAGKIFWLRWHRTGDGTGSYISGTDNVMVNISNELAAPEGLHGTRLATGSLGLVWKGPDSLYGLNHIGMMRQLNMSFGNEGKDIICANLFDKDDLAPFQGKYITHVSALVNYMYGYEDKSGIHAKVVVFEGNEIVREQDFGELAYNAYNAVKLDEPFLVKGDKEIKVGVRLYDYDEWQWPCIAAVGDDYIPGKSDLYTEDGGKTWERVSDLYDKADIRGHGRWDITAHLVDTPEGPEVDYSLMPFVQTVYRDGEPLNVAALDGNARGFRDDAPVDNMPYQISVQSKEGAHSPLSEAFILSPSGVSALSDEAGKVVYDPASASVISYDARRLCAFDTEGRLVAMSEGHTLSMAGLPAGFYVVIASGEKGTVRAKLIIR